LHNFAYKEIIYSNTSYTGATKTLEESTLSLTCYNHRLSQRVHTWKAGDWSKKVHYPVLLEKRKLGCHTEYRVNTQLIIFMFDFTASNKLV